MILNDQTPFKNLQHFLQDFKVCLTILGRYVLKI